MKKTLNEEVSRIREMMGVANETPNHIDDFDTQITPEELPGEHEGMMSDELGPDGSGIPTGDMKDIEKAGGEDELELGGDDYEDDEYTSDDPSDDQIMNGFGREGGISYGSQPAWNGR